jgi:hypothetical protein
VFKQPPGVKVLPGVQKGGVPKIKKLNIKK